MPLATNPQTPQAGVGGSMRKETEIVVIPEKFYGVALKMKELSSAETIVPPAPPKPVAPPAPKPKIIIQQQQVPRHSVLPIVLTVIGFVLIVGSGFVYFNRALLFNQPAPTPVTPPAPKGPPAAPTNLSALVAGGSSVALSWVDTSEESGYRIERQEDPGTFVPLTNLPANSTAFLDVSVAATKSYRYRLIALGEGGDSAPSNEASVATPTPVAQAPQAPSLPPGGLDSDSDGLSDLEEPLYGTDTFHPDTDNDGFLDGNEVFHLYNPAAEAPVKLLDSGLVALFAAPAGWSMYAPTKWAALLDVPDGSRATINTGHGEKFLIKIEDNPQHLPLLDWYLAKNPGSVSNSVRTIKTKGGLQGLIGADRLDASFAWDGKVLTVVYDIGGQPFINYRTTYEMILNSLRLAGEPVLAEPSNVGGPGDLVGSTTTSAGTSPATSTTNP